VTSTPLCVGSSHETARGAAPTTTCAVENSLGVHRCRAHRSWKGGLPNLTPALTAAGHFAPGRRGLHVAGLDVFAGRCGLRSRILFANGRGLWLRNVRLNILPGRSLGRHHPCPPDRLSSSSPSHPQRRRSSRPQARASLWRVLPVRHDGVTLRNKAAPATFRPCRPSRQLNSPV
jgi:hypothetical protein